MGGEPHRVDNRMGSGEAPLIELAGRGPGRLRYIDPHLFEAIRIPKILILTAEYALYRVTRTMSTVDPYRLARRVAPTGWLDLVGVLYSPLV